MGAGKVGLVGAAGIVLILWGGRAQAAPVIKSLNVPVTVLTNPSPNDFVDLDLNDDSVPDLRIVHQSFKETGINFADSTDTASGLNGATLLLNSSFAAALHPGQSVGPAGTFSAGSILLIDTQAARHNAAPVGGNLAFLDPDVALGVKIPVSGQAYFAWLGVQSKDNKTGQFGTNTLLLHDYGYETAPNTAVAAEAPEPSALALLAPVLGACVLRRRRSS